MAARLELVGVAEIAELFGMTRQGVHLLIQRSDDFPEPVAVLSAGKIWRKNDVVRWGQRNGRV